MKSAFLNKWLRPACWEGALLIFCAGAKALEADVASGEAAVHRTYIDGGIRAANPSEGGLQI
jgi:hypothetical protein